MKVEVKGVGVFHFPDEMGAAEIADILREKFAPQPEREDYGIKALQAVQALLEREQEKIVSIVKEPVTVKEQVFIEKPDVQIKTVDVPVIVKEYIKPKSWRFELERDEDDLIKAIIAVPL